MPALVQGGGLNQRKTRAGLEGREAARRTRMEPDLACGACAVSVRPLGIILCDSGRAPTQTRRVMPVLVQGGGLNQCKTRAGAVGRTRTEPDMACGACADSAGPLGSIPCDSGRDPTQTRRVMPILVQRG